MVIDKDIECNICRVPKDVIEHLFNDYSWHYRHPLQSSSRQKGTEMQVKDVAMAVIDLSFNYEREYMERSLLHGK